MLKMLNVTSINKILKLFTPILYNLHNFHPLKNVDRVSEILLQVGKKNNNLAVKRLSLYTSGFNLSLCGVTPPPPPSSSG